MVFTFVLYRYHIEKLNQDLINNLNKSITPKKLVKVSKSLPTKTAQNYTRFSKKSKNQI